MKCINKLVIAVLALTLASCAFQSEEDGNTEQLPSTRLTSVDLSKLDSDGDFVTDLEEIENGRNSRVADLPVIKSRFLQNYRIDLTRFNRSEGEETFSIDTSVHQGDPDFKYRVGKIFARENAFNSAARVGKFSSHSSGTIVNRDLSWIKFPEVDQKFFLRNSLELNHLFDDEAYISSVEVFLENSVKLKGNGLFKEIQNLEVSFYYYNYEAENYELLGTNIIERHFKAGVNETFEVALGNVPMNLVKDNYLAKGEFIISEITNYEIPELGTTYKSLIRSVKAKTLPVIFNTPLESENFYVAVSSKGESFIEVMSEIFGHNFEVSGDTLSRVGQFVTNLGDFTYLKDVKEKDKLGKWFVFTRELQTSYLDQKFKRADPIVISYITGKELASRSEEKIYGQRYFVTGGQNFRVIPLGNVSPNSKVDIHIRPDRKAGTNISRETKIVDRKSGSCGVNCIARGIYCRWEINHLSIYDEVLNVNKTLSGELKQLSLIINDSEFDLQSLVKEEKVRVYWPTSNLLHLSIEDVSKIMELNNFDENLIALKVTSSVKNDFVGMKLTAVDRYWKDRNGCPQGTVTLAAIQRKIPISTESIHMDRIKGWASSLKEPHRQNLSFRDRENFYDQIFISVSSLINNYHN